VLRSREVQPSGYLPPAKLPGPRSREAELLGSTLRPKPIARGFFPLPLTRASQGAADRALLVARSALLGSPGLWPTDPGWPLPPGRVSGGLTARSGQAPPLPQAEAYCPRVLPPPPNSSKSRRSRQSAASQTLHPSRIRRSLADRSCWPLPPGRVSGGLNARSGQAPPLPQAEAYCPRVLPTPPTLSKSRRSRQSAASQTLHPSRIRRSLADRSCWPLPPGRVSGGLNARSVQAPPLPHLLFTFSLSLLTHPSSTTKSFPPCSDPPVCG
jgi:hypothetical protein